MPAIKAAPTTPPTTPPAIAPVFELLLEDELDEDAGEAVWGVTVDWLFLVEVGILEPLPVTSGESGREPRIGRC